MLPIGELNIVLFVRVMAAWLGKDGQAHMILKMRVGSGGQDFYELHTFKL